MCDLFGNDLEDLKGIGKEAPKYPKDYFEALNGDKPAVKFYKMGNVDPVSDQSDMETYKKTAILSAKKTIIENSRLTLSNAMTILTAFCFTIKGKRLKEWSSFGIKISDGNSEVYAKDLFKAETSLSYEGLTEAVNDTISDWGKTLLSYTYLYLAVYRWSIWESAQSVKSVTKDRRDALYKVLQMLGLPPKCEEVDTFLTLIRTGASYVADKDFVKLVAGIDMFLYNIEDEEWSKMRMATLGARYKDCAGLLELTWASESMGMSSLEFGEYVFATEAQKEITALLKTGNELKITMSYTPYLACLSMSGNSPYSTSYSKTLHHLIHIIMCCAGEPRSINARVHSSALLGSMLNLGMFLGYILLDKTQLSRLLYADKDDMNRNMNVIKKQLKIENDEWNKLDQSQKMTKITNYYNELREKEESETKSSTSGINKYAKYKGMKPNMLFHEFALKMKGICPKEITRKMMSTFLTLHTEDRTGTFGYALKERAEAYFQDIDKK